MAGFLQNLFGGSPTGAQLATPPDYILSVHKDMVAHAQSMVDQQFWGKTAASPYSLAHSYNPSDAIIKMQRHLDSYHDKLLALESKVLWQTCLAQAGADATTITGDPAADTIATDAVTGAGADHESLWGTGNPLNDAISSSTDASITDAISAYVAQQESTLAENSARLASGYNDIGAINSSGYWIAQALLESEFNKQTGLMSNQTRRERDQIKSQIELRLNDQIAGIVTQLAANRTNLASSMNDQKTRLKLQLSEANLNSSLKVAELYRSILESEVTVGKTNLIANKEYIAEELMRNVEDRMWDTNFIKDTCGILSGIQGVMTSRGAPSPLTSALSAGMSGLSQIAPLAIALGPAGVPVAIGAALLSAIGGSRQANESIGNQ